MLERIDTNDPTTPVGTTHGEELAIACYFPDDDQWALIDNAITSLADGREKLAVRRRNNAAKGRTLRFKLVTVGRTLSVTEVPEDGPLTWRVTVIGIHGTEFTYIEEAATEGFAVDLAYAQHGRRMRDEHTLEALGTNFYAEPAGTSD
jgi:hypothetical protein